MSGLGPEQSVFVSAGSAIKRDRERAKGVWCVCVCVCACVCVCVCVCVLCVCFGGGDDGIVFQPRLTSLAAEWNNGSGLRSAVVL